MLDRTKYARQFAKILKTKCGTYREMYKRIHGEEPSKQDVQTFTNYVNRGNYNMTFLLQLLDTFELDDVTFGEFFNGHDPQNRSSNRNRN